ncbi:hypothetical protein IscW_ISCW013441, partial [Ixodes scapularis]
MSLLLVIFAVLLTLGRVIHAAHAQNTAANYPELRPELGKYQDDSKCFPMKETWYVTYRSHEIDPGFGGKAKCVKDTISPFTFMRSCVHVAALCNGSISGRSRSNPFTSKMFLRYSVPKDMHILCQKGVLSFCTSNHKA